MSSGLNTALIQKKDASELEFNTIFYCNLILGGIVYVVFFIAAPFIAEAYDTPILTTAMRVFALRLPISSFQSIQSAYVSRTMNFKKFLFCNNYWHDCVSRCRYSNGLSGLWSVGVNCSVSY